MEQCQEELLRKKNLIIQKLRSTKTSLSDFIKNDPILWDEKCFSFDLSSHATLLLKADILVLDPTKYAVDEIEDLSNKMNKPIQIFVTILDGLKRTIVLNVKRSNTFKKLKDMIQEKEGIPSDQQLLNFNGKPLKDGLTLHDYKINKELTIEMVRRSQLIFIFSKNYFSE